MTVDWNEQADEGVRLFNTRHFFEAHDVLEEIWIEKGGDERLFYQGLIQVAVGFYKIDVGNHGGARSLLRKGIDKLERVRHVESPIDFHRLIDEAGAVLERLLELGPERLAEIEIERLPRIHYLRDGVRATGSGNAPRDDE